MVDPKDLVTIIEQFTGRKLSDSDIMDYAYFLKGSESIFDDKRREQIRSELASIVMHNPGLVKKISEEYGCICPVKVAPFSECKLVLSSSSASCQETALNKTNSNKQVMASLPDFYRFFKTLRFMNGKGDYAQIEQADILMKILRRFSSILTSTSVVFRQDSLDAQIVHQYNVEGKEPEKINIFVPEFNHETLIDVMKDSAGQRYVQALLGTNDCAEEIVDHVSFSFGKNKTGNIFVCTCSKAERINYVRAVGMISRASAISLKPKNTGGVAYYTSNFKKK